MGPSNTLLFCRPLKKPRVTRALQATHHWLWGQGFSHQNPPPTEGWGGRRAAPWEEGHWCCFLYWGDGRKGAHEVWPRLTAPDLECSFYLNISTKREEWNCFLTFQLCICRRPLPQPIGRGVFPSAKASLQQNPKPVVKSAPHEDREESQAEDLTRCLRKKKRVSQTRRPGCAGTRHSLTVQLAATNTHVAT